MAQEIGLFILSNNQLFQDCLQLALGRYEGLSVVGAASITTNVLDRIAIHPPSVVLLEVNDIEESVVNLIRNIGAKYQTKIIVLGINEDESTILKCIESGVNGYVLKENSLEFLINIIHLVSAGETICSPRIAYHTFSRMAELARLNHYEQVYGSKNLTFREMEILRLIALGMSNKEIANKLCLSLHTVKNHVHNILEKLQVRDRTEAVNYLLTIEGLKNTSQR